MPTPTLSLYSSLPHVSSWCMGKPRIGGRRLCFSDSSHVHRCVKNAHRNSTAQPWAFTLECCPPGVHTELNAPSVVVLHSQTSIDIYNRALGCLAKCALTPATLRSEDGRFFGTRVRIMGDSAWLNATLTPATLGIEDGD